jgi:hypothetical protein
MQCASSFDKSTLSRLKAFLLKIHPKIIFADRIFLLIEKFLETQLSRFILRQKC